MACGGGGESEAERRVALLRDITEEGGFAFVASAEKAAAGDLRAAEAAREMAWEQLHSGPWSEVGSAWRDAYALACLHVARLRRVAADRRAALRALDMGLIMGGNLLRADLEAALACIAAEPSDGDGDGAEAVDEEAKRWREGLDRNRDIADALKILPTKSLSCKEIARRSCISLEEFICDYFLCETPVIISGCIDHWPAMTKWKDIQYLKKIAGDRTVPVEVGKSYVCSEWKQELITFSQFLERMWSTACPSNLTYLAQHPLFEQIKELHGDIMVPDYCYAGGGELQSLNAWFGPHGTVTPLHHDPHHNILAQIERRDHHKRLFEPGIENQLRSFACQAAAVQHNFCSCDTDFNLSVKTADDLVLGRKYIRLYPGSVSEDLYPHTETMLSNTSQVDLDNIDINEFPKVENLDFMDCILEEGDMLYIPPKWWHYVRSLSISFSISFWWRTTVITPSL